MLDDFVLQTILPSTHDLGGFKVHRTLPNKERTMVGPFLFFDQMGPAHLGVGNGIDVRPHPHINLATVTYLFDGAIDHRDSLGTSARIEPGAVNLMTAGHGIVHSERSPGDERTNGPNLSGIQTWLALPEAQEEMNPAFEHVAKAQLPTIEAHGARARIIMGDLWGEAWVWISLVLFVVVGGLMTPLASLKLAPMRAAAGMASSGPEPAVDSAELVRLLDAWNPVPLAVAGLGGFLIILWLMLAKPF